jgi:hypothetical protein
VPNSLLTLNMEVDWNHTAFLSSERNINCRVREHFNCIAGCVFSFYHQDSTETGSTDFRTICVLGETSRGRTENYATNVIICKVKSCPCAQLIKHHAMKMNGGVGVYIHLFLTSALIGGGE